MSTDIAESHIAEGHAAESHAADPPPPSLRPNSLPPTRLEAIGLKPNALWLREMRQQMRLPRTPFALFALALLFSLFICSVGGISATNHSDLATLGEVIFQTYFSMANFIVLLVGPSIAASSIALERESRTYEALVLTGLSPQEIVHGKFFSAMTMISLYIVFNAPIGAVAFIFGGITAFEVLLAFLLLLLFAALSVMFGLAVSSMTQSMRGALVATLLLAVIIGMPLFSLSWGLSAVAHQIWSVVPSPFPVWLPLALSRVPFGLDYFSLLVFAPAACFVIPFWFFYNVAISNLQSESEDRSSSHRLWLIGTSLLLLLGGLLAVRSITPSASLGTAAGFFGLVWAFFIFLSFFFASEPPGPTRRVEFRWMRDRVPVWRKLFRPSLLNAQTTVLFLFALVVAPVLFFGVVLHRGHTSSASFSGSGSDDVKRILLAVLFLSPFLLLSSGLNSFFRSKGNTAWRARTLSFSTLFLLSIVPWVLYAIFGLANGHNKEILVLATPSPFFVFPLVESVNRGHEGLYAMAAIAGCLFWSVIGLILLAMAHSRSRQSVAAEKTRLAEIERILSAEDTVEMAAGGVATGSGLASEPIAPQA